MIPHRVHFVGIGGIGMSALARHLLATGHAVSGSDRAPGEQGDALRALGATIDTGHDASYIAGAELVVFTPATGDTPEVIAAREAGIPVIKRADLLAAIANPASTVAVAGTHGKTTTSALIAHILIEAALDPTVLIGGISKNLRSNARKGGTITVVEADEFDAAFLRLYPQVAVITNVEPEHLDFYQTAQRLQEAFRRFASQAQRAVIVCADDPGAIAAVGELPTVITYGIDRGKVRSTDITEEDGVTHFTVGGRQFTMRLAGVHNVKNAAAAITAARMFPVHDDAIVRALATFEGVARRLEIIGQESGVLVMDSYGHHPTEIRSDLAAVRSRHHRPIRLVFQPHTYSRTHAFMDDFASAFGDADEVYLLDIYAAREKNTLGISGQDLATAACRQHPHVRYTETMEATLERLLHDVRPGDLVLTMGAGDVNHLAPRLLEGLRP